MNYQYNPYAAPQAGFPPPAAPPGAPGVPQPWTVGEMFSIAWARFKPNWVVLVFSWFALMAISMVLGFATMIAIGARAVPPDSPLAIRMMVGSGFVRLLVTAFLQVGLLRISLDVARDRTPSFGALFLGGDRFFALLGVFLLQSLIVVVGLLLLVVPGVIAALGLSLTQYYVVDAKMGPIDAMKASWAATRGQKGEIFVLLLASVGVMLLGALACCLGMLVAAPVALVALSAGYTRISGIGAAPPLPVW